MTTTAIRKQIETILTATHGSESQNRDDSIVVLFDANGSQDSVTALKIIMRIEDTFNITVEDDEISPANFAHVSDLVRYIERKLRGLNSGK